MSDNKYKTDFNMMLTIASEARGEEPIETLVCLLSDAITSPWVEYDYDKNDEIDAKYYETYDESKRSIELRLAFYLLNGGTIKVIDRSAIEEDGDTVHLITRDVLDMAAMLFVREGTKHFSDFITEYDDEITGDAFLQFACFAGYRYG